MWKGKKIREIRKSQKKFWPFLVAKRFSQTKSLQTAQPAAHWAVGRAVFYKEERRRLHGNCEGVCARFLDGFYLTLTAKILGSTDAAKAGGTKNQSEQNAKP